MKKYFKSITKEIIPVILGVLIALFINNWNEDRKDRKYFNEILDSIESELVETEKDIELRITSQNSLIDTLEFYSEEDISLNEIMGKTNGVTIPTIRLHSWKALSNSKIELLNYDDLSNLVNIEEDKELLKEKSKYMMNFLYNNITKKDQHNKFILHGLMMDLINTEDSILMDIQELIKSLKDQ